MYFFKKRNGFWGHYEQYPSGSEDSFRKIIRDMPHSKHEIILVRRFDDRIYYIYLCPLNKREVIGIGIISDYYCLDFEQLIISFRIVVENIIKEKVIIKKNGKTYAFKPNSLSDEHVIIDIFLRKNDMRINGDSVNSANLSISKSDVVECVFEERGSAWIVEQLTGGYHNINISYSGNTKYRDENPILNNFIWGWKTWTLFCIMSFIILALSFGIMSNPILKSQFRYTIEKYIP